MKKKISPYDRFTKLRKELHKQGLLQPDVANIVGCSVSSISEKLRGLIPWNAWEMYAILDKLGVEYFRMHEYFPKDGLDAKTSGIDPMKLYCEEHSVHIISDVAWKMLKHAAMEM